MFDLEGVQTGDRDKGGRNFLAPLEKDLDPEEGRVGLEIQFPKEDLIDLFFGDLNIPPPEISLVEEELPVGLFLKGGIGIPAVMVVLLLLGLR